MRILLFLLLFLHLGCAKRSEVYNKNLSGGYASPGGGDSYALEEIAVADSGGRSYKAKPKRESMAGAPAPPPPPPASPAPSPAPAPAPAPASEPKTPQRMVHYDGFARIRATKTEELLDQVEAIAKEVGGRVDRLYGTTITIRVPVADFEDSWDRILELGDVLDRSVRADDITEQFMAVDLRVKTLTETRERLVELLAKATEEEEKLALLAQITRVTEELDAFESQLRVLGDLAAMSRITVEAVPRQQFTGTSRPEYDGFHWIAAISPFRRAVFDDDKRVALPETAGLVTLSKRGPFVAESADGTVLWTMRLRNDPMGEGAFWVSAIQDRLNEQFTGLNPHEVGAWSCLDLDEAGADEPYRWMICVQPRGKHLYVAQAWFPDPEQVERYGGRIEGALAFMGGES